MSSSFFLRPSLSTHQFTPLYRVTSTVKHSSTLTSNHPITLILTITLPHTQTFSHPFTLFSPFFLLSYIFAPADSPEHHCNANLTTLTTHLYHHPIAPTITLLLHSTSLNLHFSIHFIILFYIFFSFSLYLSYFIYLNIKNLSLLLFSLSTPRSLFF